MTWEQIIKFEFKPKDNKKTPKKKDKGFKGFKGKRGGKDTMKDFDVSTFPRDACSSWQPMGRGCHNKAEWACTTCGAQWCDDHRFSGMDGHSNQVYIGDDKRKQGKRIGDDDKRDWQRRNRGEST